MRDRVRAITIGIALACFALAAADAPAAGAALAAGAAQEARPSEAHWIFFRDRGALGREGPARAAALAEAAERLTPRSLARRAKAVRERTAFKGGEGASDATMSGSASTLDERDLGPDPAYVRDIEAAGAVVRTRSRWLNAVSVDAAAETLARIRGLPFVLETRPVARQMPDLAAGAADRGAADPGAADPGAAPAPDAPAAFDRAEADFNAGPSYLQLDMHHIPEVHAMGLHGEGVLICVLDSGFQLDHEAFRQLEVRAQHDFIFDDDDPSYDARTDSPSQSSHGTLVLSALGGYKPGKLIGVAYRADFMLGKTERIGAEEPIEEDHWCAGIEWAEAMGADVVSSSLDYPNWYTWRDMDGRTGVATRAANLAFERGLLIVNAMGNTGWTEGRLGAPADAPGAISVGAVNGIGALAGFSTVGPTWDRRVKPDVCALGVAVWTATPRTYDRYGRVNGTSLSTPIAAGVVALILEAHPDWGPEMVREALTMSADRADRPDNRYGWGIVNARDAVLYPLIEGRVTDMHTREPIEGAVVRWEPAGAVDTTRVAASDSPPRGSARTDSTGAYLVPNLPRGAYKLIFSKPGYFNAEMGPYDVPPNLGDVNAALRYRGE